MRGNISVALEVERSVYVQYLYIYAYMYCKIFKKIEDRNPAFFYRLLSLGKYGPIDPLTHICLNYLMKSSKL